MLLAGEVKKKARGARVSGEDETKIESREGNESNRAKVGMGIEAI
jgi:hypothetical protein